MSTNSSKIYAQDMKHDTSNKINGISPRNCEMRQKC